MKGSEALGQRIRWGPGQPENKKRKLRHYCENKKRKLTFGIRQDSRKQGLEETK
jgi:hypothetical protein